ncbi:MAG: permease [Anaerolineae bacterium]|nr:permease [Anaerolineae bacterium]
MTTHIRHLPKIDTDRRAFVLVGMLLIVWIVLYNYLQPIADWFTYRLLQFSPDDPLGQSLNFFLYDVPKILLLLSGMIFLISLLQTFMDTQKVRALVEKRGTGIGNLMAALFGALTPFCSCSSVPLFIGFVEAGIPLGITFSFLITSPIMNEVALVLLLGLFGWQVALMYLISGIAIGVIAGMVLGRMKLERYVEPFVFNVKANRAVMGFEAEKPTWLERFADSAEKTREIVGKVWLFVILGIGIGALIHGFVPEDALVSIMGEDAWWSVPLSVLLGIPLYSNAAGVIPIVSALLDKGAALGTALAFMMSVVALSLPEMIILRRVLKPQLLAIFAAVIGVSILITGYLFNLVM